MTEKTTTEKTAAASPSAATTAPVSPAEPVAEAAADIVTVGKGPQQKPGEIGGPKGPEPTRYGDWEFKGRCSDF